MRIKSIKHRLIFTWLLRFSIEWWLLWEKCLIKLSMSYSTKRKKKELLSGWQQNLKNLANLFRFLIAHPIKNTEQKTMKISAEFNRSLKIRGNYSVDVTAYRGIDRINNLIEVLLKVRTNKSVMMGNIKKGF